MSRLIVDERVTRCRRPEPGERVPKARWVLHRADCVYAVGCTPLADLVAKVGERGVLGRVRDGLIARCKTCRPTLLAPDQQ